MKKIILGFTLLFLFSLSFGQNRKRYIASGPELILSTSDFKSPTIDTKQNVRFSGIFNWGSFSHYNLSKHTGIYTGLEIRNVGMINTFPKINTTDEYKLKQRVYTLGIPIGLKIGNMDNLTFLYGGVSFDFALTYKEKKFVDSEKQYSKTAWFSKKTNTFLPSVFLGFQFKSGNAFTMRYYINDFLNTDYKENGVKIYAGSTSHLFNISYSILLYNVRKSEMKKLAQPTPTKTI